MSSSLGAGGVMTSGATSAGFALAISALLEDEGAHGGVFRLEQLAQSDRTLRVARQRQLDLLGELAEGLRHLLQRLRQVRVSEKLLGGLAHEGGAPVAGGCVLLNGC